MNWKNVTVRKYQQLVELGKMELSNKEATQEAIAILSGLTINEVRQLSERDAIKWQRKIGFIHKELKAKKIRHIKVNGRVYCTDINVEHMPCARYIETKYFGQDIVGNMHKLAAVMVCPVKRTLFKYKRLEYDTLNFQQYSDDMLDVSIVYVMGMMVFFCQKLGILTASLSDCLDQEVRNRNMTMTESEMTFIRFKNNTDGFIKRYWSHNTTTPHWRPHIKYQQSNS